MSAQSFCDALLAPFDEALKTAGEAGSEPTQKEIWQAVMVTTRPQPLPFPAVVQRITVREVIPVAHSVKHLLRAVTTERRPTAPRRSLRGNYVAPACALIAAFVEPPGIMNGQEAMTRLAEEIQRSQSFLEAFKRSIRLLLDKHAAQELKLRDFHRHFQSGLRSFSTTAYSDTSPPEVSIELLRKLLSERDIIVERANNSAVGDLQ